MIAGAGAGAGVRENGVATVEEKGLLGDVDCGAPNVTVEAKGAAAGAVAGAGVGACVPNVGAGAPQPNPPVDGTEAGAGAGAGADVRLAPHPLGTTADDPGLGPHSVFFVTGGATADPEVEGAISLSHETHLTASRLFTTQHEEHFTSSAEPALALAQMPPPLPLPPPPPDPAVGARAGAGVGADGAMLLSQETHLAAPLALGTKQTGHFTLLVDIACAHAEFAAGAPVAANDPLPVLVAEPEADVNDEGGEAAPALSIPDLGEFDLSLFFGCGVPLRWLALDRASPPRDLRAGGEKVNWIRGLPSSSTSSS